METNEPNKYYRPVHRPHQKMKFPLLGGGKNESSKERRQRRSDEVPERRVSDWGNDLIPKLIPLAIVAFIAYAIWDTFGSIGGTTRNIVEKPEAIQQLAWNNSKIAKKYAEVTSKRTRLLLEVIDGKGEHQLVDFAKEKTAFWDHVDPRNLLTKPAGSLNVFVNTYERDTTLTMKFTP